MKTKADSYRADHIGPFTIARWRDEKNAEHHCQLSTDSAVLTNLVSDSSGEAATWAAGAKAALHAVAHTWGVS